MEDTGEPWSPLVSEEVPGAATTRPQSRPAAPEDLEIPAVPDQGSPEEVADQEVPVVCAHCYPSGMHARGHAGKAPSVRREVGRVASSP